ncbi:MAG: PRC-barrel domain-containing protein [Chloroflexota bacterium]|nr:PRC-barrel domain-containing protein [Chloroflexota bacterium]
MTELDLSNAAGKPVDTYDDERLGVTEGVVTHPGTGRRYLVVVGTLFGTGKYYVPEEEIRRSGEHRILLGTTRDDLRELDWFAPPEGIEPANDG